MIGLARVMRSPRPFKTGGAPNVSDTYRGQILTDTGQLKAAILKDLPQKELANEVLSAALAKAIGLPIPEAYIGITRPNSPWATKARLSDHAGLMFASVDVSSPSIAQWTNAPDNPNLFSALKPIIDFITNQIWIGGLYAFDAWVANIDRNMQNILLGPKGPAWLIDHAQCFGGPSWQAIDLIPDAEFLHKLKLWMTPNIDASRRQKLATEAAGFVDQLKQIDVRAIGANNQVNSLLDPVEYDALIFFLTKRVLHVPRAASDALGFPRLI